MTETPHSIIMKLASKYPLRRQLILLIIIVFTILGTILFISLSKLTQASIFHEIPMVEIEPIYSVEQNPTNPTKKSNPTIPVDLESVQSLALLQLQSKLQKILGITVSGALAVGLILAIWLSAFITTPIKSFTQEMSSVKRVGSEFGGAAMPSQELSDLHSAIVSSLDRFEKELDDQNQFLMDVAHEFRTPVASIRMKIDVDTKKPSVSPDDFFSLCQSVDRSTTRLEQLLAKLNSLPKFGSHIQVSDVSLSKLVTETIELLSPLSRMQSIEVENQIGSNMSVRTEPLFLQTIITNLIENAIKYNKENGKVIVSACAIEGGCEVHVVDTGIGISRDEIGKVFNRFYRVDKSRSRKNGGSGLGLSTVKTLLNRLGGRISIQSQLDKGTEVVFFIPNYQENIETSYDEKEKNEEV